MLLIWFLWDPFGYFLSVLGSVAGLPYSKGVCISTGLWDRLGF